MQVTPVDTPTPPPASGTAPRPTTPSGDFDVALHQALGAAAASPGARLTLGQMLHLYAAPGLGRVAGVASGAPPATSAPESIAPGAPTTLATATTAGAVDSLGIGPLARPLPGEVGSAHGMRRHPIHGDVRMHHGVDIGAPTGTPIHAFAGGTVSFAGPRGGYGNVVIVEHPDGLETRYAHQSTIDVVVGQRVEAGQVVGRVGATGTATGPHLHFELRRGGSSMDPTPYLPGA